MTRSAWLGAQTAAARSPSSRIAVSASGVEARVQQAAGAESDVPALVAQDEFGAFAQAWEPVVDQLEQRELAGGEYATAPSTMW